MEETKIENEQKAAEASANTQGEEMSASKKKRLERQKKNSKQKTENLIWRVIGYVIIVLFIAVVAFLIGSLIYRNSQKVTASADYSGGLTDTGYIEGVSALSKVGLVDYKNIKVPMSEVEFSDAEVQKDIDQKLDTYKTLNENSTKAVENGDKVNIDYVGSIDGVEFEGGNSGGSGFDLEIGSGSFIPGFEDQVIGHKAGEVFTIDVTFPEEYNNQELAGKDAQFEITLHGIYEKSTFDDAFVKEHLSGFADTAEGYKQYLKDTNYEKNLEEWVDNYLVENSTVNSYPSRYLKTLKSVEKYSAKQTYEYMNQMYVSYYGAPMYESFDDYTGMSEEEYDLSLNDTCKETEKEALVYQAIAESEGYVPTEDDVKADLEEAGTADNYDSQLETFGLGYLSQQTLQERMLKMVIENVTVE